MKEKYERLIPNYGEETFKKIQNHHVLVIGLGGVGGFVCETLARTGIHHLSICDGDIVEYSNFNRQIIATDENLGRLKTEAIRKRISSINDDILVDEYSFFIDEKTIEQIDFSQFDLVLDCIDDVNAKIEIIKKCKMHNVEMISCMGTGNKSNPYGFKIADINQTSYCPLAKKVRTELKKIGIANVKVCFSDEQIQKNDNHMIASQIFVVGSAGFLIAKEAIEILKRL